jgi:hypothetical protein
MLLAVLASNPPSSRLVRPRCLVILAVLAELKV